MRILLILIIFFSVNTAFARSKSIYTDIACDVEKYNFEDMYENQASYNSEIVASGLGVFAAMSYNTYFDSEATELFDITGVKLEHPWKRLNWINGQSRIDDSDSGLQLGAYYRELDDCVIVVTCIRGTDSKKDWSTNIDAGLGFPRKQNQYLIIDGVYDNIRAFAEKRFGKKVHYLAVGHSLGGGLAEHLANCFIATTSISFDPSFVTYSARCKFKNSNKIRVYEKGEPFYKIEKFRGRFINRSRGGLIKVYNLNSIELGEKNSFRQHNMLGLAAGMLRLSLSCLTENYPNCELKKNKDFVSLKIAEHLYCDSLNKIIFKLDNFKPIQLNNGYSRKKYDVVCH